jgi:hypothetical protein
MGGINVYGFISGYTVSDNINFCPRCAKLIGVYYGDGTARCDGCGFRFGVVESEEDDGTD